jgi:arylsulfatase A-like enzyme
MKRLLQSGFFLMLGFFMRMEASTGRAQPNLIFILADDLGWADVGFHKGNVPTPNLDNLAAEGVELSQHYVYPVCSPTRAALLSGRYATRFGVTTPQNERAYRWEITTLAHALKSVGYATALVGKWHLGSLAEQGPNHFGFDHSYGSLAGGVSPWNHFYKKGRFSRTWHRNEEFLEETGHVTDLLADEAVRWIQGRGAAPFFLYLPFTAVHLPLKEPREWVERVPAGVQGEIARHYGASVMHFDDAVGRVLEALKKMALLENTIVVFTSDNGGSTAENNDSQYPDDQCPGGPLPGNNRPLRGQKGDLHEGGIRVPTLVYAPGRLKAGKFEGVAHVCDWMPTLCSVAGYFPGQDLRWDGIDLWPQLTGAAPVKPRAVYMASPGFNARMLREADWKLIEPRAPAGIAPGQKPRVMELYDIAMDPFETKNLASSMPDRVAELTEKLREVSKSDGDASAK